MRVLLDVCCICKQVRVGILRSCFFLFAALPFFFCFGIVRLIFGWQQLLLFLLDARSFEFPSHRAFYVSSNFWIFHLVIRVLRPFGLGVLATCLSFLANHFPSHRAFYVSSNFWIF